MKENMKAFSFCIIPLGSYATLSSLLMAKLCIVCDEHECWPLPSPMASATPLKVHRRVRESLCLHRHSVDGNAPPSPRRPPSSVSPSVSARHKHALKPNKQNPVVMWAWVPDPTMFGPSLHPETKLDSTSNNSNESKQLWLLIKETLSHCKVKK